MGTQKKSVKFRSHFEKEIKDQIVSSKIKYTYEEEKIRFTYPAKNRLYTPDFIIYTKSGKKIYIEAKGIWVFDDRYKHLLLRQQHPELDIRFVFYNSKNKISKRSKTSYADICKGLGRTPFKGITWKYSDKKIPKEWFNE